MLLAVARVKSMTSELGAHLACHPPSKALLCAFNSPDDERCSGPMGDAQDFIRDVLRVQQMERPRAENYARRSGSQRPLAIGIGAHQQRAVQSRSAQPRAEVAQHTARQIEAQIAPSR